MTLSPETLLLGLNGIILCLAYFLIYPRMVADDINKFMSEMDFQFRGGEERMTGKSDQSKSS